MSVILAIVLIVILFGTLPVYPYSRSWGYRPFGGGLGLILLILVILLLAGRL